MSKRLGTASNIWITGASSGIGEAVTHALVDQGHRLVITGRRQEALDGLSALAPERVVAARADTTSRDDLQGISSTLETHGDLNMAILNAGTCEYLEIADYDSAVIENNINTNVVGTARCLDIALPANTSRRFPFDTRRQGFAYIFEGSASFGNASAPFGINVEKEFAGEEMKIRDQSGNRTLVVFGAGDEVEVTSGEKGVRFLLVSGAPLREPVAWHGPIVMNTRAELQEAFRELNAGQFVKTGAEGWINSRGRG